MGFFEHFTSYDWGFPLNIIVGMISMVFRVLEFILVNFHIIAGIFLFAMAFLLILGMKPAPHQSKLAAYLLLFGTLLHVIIQWNTLGEDGRLIQIIIRCLLPVLPASFVMMILSDNPGLQVIGTLIAYLVTFVLGLVFNSFLTFIIVGVMAVVIFVTFIYTDQDRMDAALRDDDSFTVQRLWEKGVRPTGLHSWFNEYKIKQKLMRNGVNPYDDENS